MVILLNMPSIITIFAIAVVVLFFVKKLSKPNNIHIDKQIQKEQLNIEDRYNLTKVAKQKEVDRILEKISKEGKDSLTKKEQEVLNEFSRS